MSFCRESIIKEYHNLEFSASHCCIITKFYNTIFSLSLLHPSLGSELRLCTMFLIKNLPSYSNLDRMGMFHCSQHEWIPQKCTVAECDCRVSRAVHHLYCTRPWSYCETAIFVGLSIPSFNTEKFLFHFFFFEWYFYVLMETDVQILWKLIQLHCFVAKQACTNKTL
jgi:hypothetical protein